MPREDVYVAGTLLIYYEEGNPGASVAPHVFAVVGVSSHDRSSYLLWREGKAPDFVLEDFADVLPEYRGR